MGRHRRNLLRSLTLDRPSAAWFPSTELLLVHPSPTAARGTPPAQLHPPRHHRQRRLRLAARSRLSEGGGRGRAFLSEGRKRLFRRGDGSAPRADRHAVRRNARPAEGGRFERSRKGRGLALLVGICAGGGVPHMVSPPCRRRRGGNPGRRARRSRQGSVFPPGRNGGQDRKSTRLNSSQ